MNKIETTQTVKHGEWTITYNPKAIPIPDFDYDYYHNNHDGENGLCGSSDSVEGAKSEIDSIDWDADLILKG